MNQKNKKWLPIGLCIGFILAWQFFVIRPYVQKQKGAESTSTSAAADPKKIEQLNPPPAQAGATNAAQGTLSEEIRNSAATVSLGAAKRTVNIYANGMIGAATFQDYKARSKKQDESVQIMNQGLFWTASNAKVAACLSQLKKVSEKSGEALSFAALNGKEKCELNYLRDSKRPGIVTTQLRLSGFSSNEGFLEFRGVDGIGTGPDADHNYLGFKIDGSTSSVRDSSLKKNEVQTGKVDWLVWGDKYFASILIPKGNFNPNVVYNPTGAQSELTSFGFQYPLALKEGDATTFEAELYFGTRDGEELARINPALAETVDLGFFRSVARAMLWALKALEKIFHNYGLSIIALTLIVRVLFWPLNKKVYSSGQKMKSLQPKIEQLKAKYGKDKSQMEQMNRELMGLYKTHKVNPLGSCLPLLLQMPIFLGLYGALNNSLDLYQAPFFGWIHDLSSPDPFFVFPILWTVTLLAYMKLNPTPSQPGTPDMKWMMIGMNIFFGYLSHSWPAGLTLYLFVSNLVGITQQFLFQRAAKLQPIQEGA